MKQIFRYIRPFTGKIAVGLLIKTTGTLMDLALPWMLAAMLDTVAPSGNKGSILFLGLMMVLAACIGISGNVIANRIASAVARDTTRTLRSTLSRPSTSSTKPTQSPASPKNKNSPYTSPS